VSASHTAPAPRIADTAVLLGLNVQAPVPVIRLTLEVGGLAHGLGVSAQDIAAGLSA
jgi:hypothetical protein